MSISISGLGSGLPIDTWISQLVSIKQANIDKISAAKTSMTNASSDLGTLKTSYNSLLTALQKITDSSFGATSDVFAQKTATSSNSAIASASVTALAAKQTISLKVSQLATATTATSASVASGTMSGATKLSSLANGQITAGSFSLYVDNKKYSIDVATTDTVDNVLGKINGLGVSGLSASVTDGKINIADSTQGSSIVVGANTDTTNFSNIVSLVKNDDGTYSSSKTILTANTSATLTGADAGFKTAINASSFMIGTAKFTVDGTTTLNSLISQINSSKDAGATAYWDTNAGKLVLTSTTQGASNIDIQNLSGNFTDVMGLTTSTYNEDGSVASSNLASGSQTLGNYAKLSINGTDIIASSNTITSDISGLTGVTLNLASKTTDGTTTTITVGANNSTLNSALSSFVSTFNTVISQSDTATGKNGTLYGELSLTSIRDNLRTTATASITDSSTVKYNSLADIGITTGAVGADISANTNQLNIDSTKLAAALADDPDAVKKLLIGDGKNDGVFTKLKTIVNGSLDSTNGYFAARAATFTDQLKDLSDKISKQTDALATYKTELTNKFSMMDEMISKLQKQYNNISGILGTSTSSKSSSS